ncbi:hypothetical protein [Piscinibacter defluvii]|uniref:hypothetical protein n=1 Tax=Piscinibacter defluvii TaxID=1796922 RepID=UPI000FDD87CD|nr:hypothetical protein [Piscinibacter defluvii]
MGPLDATWHLLNFFAPALGVGLIAAALSKLVWFRELRGAPWWRLGLVASAAAAVALVAALVIFGRDGKMAGYALMLTACAAALWWTGLRGGKA